MPTLLLCQQCGASAPKGSSFCGNCGGSVMRAAQRAPFCGGCGSPAPLAGVFCTSCGSLVPGLISERYLPVQVMGTSATSINIKAIDSVLRRPVFIRVLVGDPDVALTAIRQSATAMAAASPVNCVRTYAFTTDISPAAVVSEWIEGPSVAGLISRGPVDLTIAAAALDGALAGLVEIHQAGVAHGFLTPRRVLVDVTGSPKIAAIGIPASGPSTARYLAPEVARGGIAAVTSASDVYSAGRLIEALLLGQDGASTASGSSAADFGSNIRTMVAQAVAPNPSDRTHSVAELRARFRDFADRTLGEGWALTGTYALAGMAVGIGAASVLAAGSVAGAGSVATGAAAGGSTTAAVSAATAVTGGASASGSGSGLAALVGAHPVVASAVAIGLGAAAVGGGVAVYGTLNQPSNQIVVAPPGQAYEVRWATDAAPSPIAGQSQVVDIDATTYGGNEGRYDRFCAIDAAGSASCWGYGVPQTMGFGFYQGGDDPTRVYEEPVAVSTEGALAGKRLVQVAVGTSNSCVLDEQGEVYCWGEIPFTEQVLGSTSESSGSPLRLTGRGALADEKLVDLSASRWGVCGLNSRGEVFCWGAFTGTSAYDSFVWREPVALSGEGFTNISVGFQEACAIASDDILTCWDWLPGDDTAARQPQRYEALGPVKAVSAGGSLCVITSGRTVKCANAIPEELPYTGSRLDRGWVDVGNTEEAVTVDVQSDAETPEYFRIGEQSEYRGNLACITKPDASIACWESVGYGFTQAPEPSQAGDPSIADALPEGSTAQVAVGGSGNIVHVITKVDNGVRAAPDACLDDPRVCNIVGNADVDGDGMADSVAVRTDQSCSQTSGCSGPWAIKVATASGTDLDASFDVTSPPGGTGTVGPPTYLTDLTGDGVAEVLVRNGGGAGSYALAAFSYDDGSLRGMPGPSCLAGADPANCGFVVDGTGNVTCEPDGTVVLGSADLQPGDSRGGGPSNGLMIATKYRWDPETWQWIDLSEGKVPMATKLFDCPGVTGL